MKIGVPYYLVTLKGNGANYIKLTTVSVIRFLDVYISALSKSIRVIDDLCLGSLGKR